MDTSSSMQNQSGPDQGQGPGAEVGQQQTGTPDPLYDLVSVLYHALQGAENNSRYQQDAQRAGDEQLARFFADVREGDRQRAERAKAQLLRCLRGSSSERDVVTESSKQSFPASDPPAHA